MSDQKIQERVLLGIALGVFSVFCMGVMDGLAKWLTASYSVLTILVVRNSISLPLSFALAARAGGREALHCNRPWLLLLRSVMIICTGGFFYAALPHLPFAEIMAITFAAPLFITILSIIFLKETVGLHRWLAVLIGFAGIVVMLRPGTDAFLPAALLPLAAAFFYALLMVLTRSLSKYTTPSGMTFWGTLTTVVIAAAGMALVESGLLSSSGGESDSLSSVFAAFYWTEPNRDGLLLLTAMAVIGTTGHIAVSYAYRFAPAAVIAPFDYTILIWGVLFGWLFWNEMPDSRVFAGAAIVVGSGLYLIYRESRAEKKRVLGTPPPACKATPQV